MPGNGLLLSSIFSYQTEDNLNKKLIISPPFIVACMSSMLVFTKMHRWLTATLWFKPFFSFCIHVQTNIVTNANEHVNNLHNKIQKKVLGIM